MGRGETPSKAASSQTLTVFATPFLFFSLSETEMNRDISGFTPMQAHTRRHSILRVVGHRERAVRREVARRVVLKVAVGNLIFRADARAQPRHRAARSRGLWSDLQQIGQMS